MITQLKHLRDLLLEVTQNTFHYSASDQKDKYIVWAEEGQGESETSDDKVSNQPIIGCITYYTKEEYDETVDTIQNKLNDDPMVSWELESVVYDEKHEYIIYLWNFEFNNPFE